MTLIAGAPLLPVAGASDRRPLTFTSTAKRRALPLQVRSKGKRNLPAVNTQTVSRRDLMLSFTAGSLGGVALFSSESAEARVDRSKMRRKFMEKLDMLRGKAGLSNPKTENGEKNQTTEPSAKEKKLPSDPPPVPFPLKEPVAPLVEAILP